MNRPAGTKFCCRGFKGEGKNWMDESPQCDDCPMRAWDEMLQEATEKTQTNNDKFPPTGELT